MVNIKETGDSAMPKWDGDFLLYEKLQFLSSVTRHDLSQSDWVSESERKSTSVKLWTRKYSLGVGDHAKIFIDLGSSHIDIKFYASGYLVVNGHPFFYGPLLLCGLNQEILCVKYIRSKIEIF